MIKYSKDFPLLKTSLAGRTFEFTDAKEEQEYLKNKKELGSSWYYYNNPIEYKNNKYGYRSPELEEIKNGFVLGFGCSYTYGFGLHLEDTWVYRLGKELNLTHLNLACSGSGPELVFYNTVLLSRYCKQNNIAPSFVGIQWSFDTRAGYWHDSGEGLLPEYRLFDFTMKYSDLDNEDCGIKAEYDRYLEAFTRFEVKKINSKIFYPLIVNQIWESLGAKVLNYHSPSTDFKNTFLLEELPYPILEIEPSTDFARDLSHPGINEHTEILNTVLKWLT